MPDGMGGFLQSPFRLLISILFLFLWSKTKDFVYILLCRPVGDHILPQFLVRCILLLLLRQQSSVLLGKLGHLRDGFAAQSVKGFFRRLVLGNLRAMLRQKFLLVAGLLIGGVDLPR